MLLHALHFDDGGLPPEVQVYSFGVSTSKYRTGTRSIASTNYADNFGNWWMLALSQNLPEAFCQFAFYVGNTIGVKLLRWEDASGNILGGLKFSSLGAIEVYTGNFASLVATGTAGIAANTWTIAELHIVTGSSGSITLRINGLDDADYSGDTGVNPVRVLRWTGYYGSSFDDIVVNDTSGNYNNTWPGSAHVFFAKVAADGATKQWTPSSGTDHYALLDETPPSATDNIRSDTVGQVDEFTFTPLPAEAQQILAVIPTVYAVKGSPLPPSRLAIGLDVGGTQGYSADLDVPTVMGRVANVFEEKPGGGEFSIGDVSGMKLLLKSAA
jgi:hypothetical protein